MTSAGTLVTVDLRYGRLAGINVFARELWGALVRHPGSQIEPVAIADRRPGRWPSDRATPGRVVEMAAPAFRPGEQILLPRLIRRLHAGVHHSPHFNVPYLARVPIVLTVHDLFPLHEPADARSRLTAAYYQTLMPLAIRRATRLAAVSAYTARDLTQTLDVDPATITVIPHGLDRLHWTRAGSHAVTDLRRRHRLPDRYFLYVGTGKRLKNLATLVRAHRPGLPALVFAGCSGDEVAEHADLTGATGNLHFLGRVSDAELPVLYSGAIATLLPSLYEAVGFTVWESMSCGTPVVASNGGGLPDTVGGAGLLLDPLDVDQWRHAMERLVEDAAETERLQLAGYRRVAGLDWSATAAAYRNLYREAAAEG
jgi:glycosyltransferase involved in cell wall biosynthesis